MYNEPFKMVLVAVLVRIILSPILNLLIHTKKVKISESERIVNFSDFLGVGYNFSKLHYNNKQNKTF